MPQVYILDKCRKDPPKTTTASLAVDLQMAVFPFDDDGGSWYSRSHLASRAILDNGLTYSVYR